MTTIREFNSKLNSLVQKLSADDILDQIGRVDDRLVRAAMISRYEQLCGEDAADVLMDRLGM